MVLQPVFRECNRPLSVLENGHLYRDFQRTGFCYRTDQTGSAKTERKEKVSTLGNIIWFLFGGIFQGLSWFFVGLLWCLTIVGIPVGKQCFKMAKLSFFPFGKEIVYGGGAGSFLLNILWLLFGGIELALVSLVNGLLFCVTIVGIPFGLQCFKLAKLALMPFGAKIIK